MDQPQAHYQWDAFHGNDHAAEERHLDQLYQSAKCNHTYTTWPGNPEVNICTKCGDWHWKK